MRRQPETVGAAFVRLGAIRLKELSNVLLFKGIRSGRGGTSFPEVNYFIK
jgi:hypothetical protein